LLSEQVDALLWPLTLHWIVVGQALLKLRAFARDLEEKQEQGRAQLEAVVRMEIRARFNAVETLQAAATTISAKAAALETRLRGAVESDVGQVSDRATEKRTRPP
jgi:hypothetical protein